MGEWKLSRLRDAGVILIDCVHKTPQAQTTGYPYVSIPQMKNGRIDFSTARLISRDDYLEWTKKAKPQRHDVILSRRTNPGVIAIDDSETEFALGQNLVLLRADGTQIYPPFLKWMTQSPDWWSQIAKFNNVGAIFDSLKCADIPNFELPLPPRDVQRTIAGLLGALDDKIELNGRMNETLEATARAIFKDWFVDYGPTRAKMEGRAPYLATDIWSLFPNRMDHEGKPEGWTDFSLAMLAVQHTTTVTPSSAPEEIFEHFSLPAYDAGQTPNRDRGETIKSNKTLIPESAILLSKLNPEIERVWVPETTRDRRQICSTEFLVFTPNAISNRPLLFGLFTERSFRTMLQSMVTGTSKSHQRVSPSALLSRQVLVGTEDVFISYSTLALPFIERVLANRAESLTLAAIRDGLLPNLMSGKIRIKDAEKIVGDAT